MSNSIHLYEKKEETKEEINYYESSQFVPGRFEYVKDSSLKKMLMDAWQAITVTENWKYILENTLENIVWLNNPQTSAIFLQIEKIDGSNGGGHSGSSFCHVMKCMKYIASHGEEKFRENFL